MAIPEALALTHSFSNHSIWLVPRSPSPYLTALNSILQRYTPEGMPPLTLHCTLFYDFVPPSNIKSLLLKMQASLSASSHTGGLCAITPTVPFTPPTRPLHFFHYPKTADDNAGFGAMIMYLTIQCTALRALFEEFNNVLSHGRKNHNDGAFIPHFALAYHSDEVRPSPYINDSAIAALWKEIETVHDQAGGVVSDEWELALWRTTGRIEEWRRVYGVIIT